LEQSAEFALPLASAARAHTHTHTHTLLHSTQARARAGPCPGIPDPDSLAQPGMAQQSALDGRGDARSSHTPSAGDQVLERDPREQPRATTPRVCRQFAVNPQPSLRKLRPTDDIVGREGVSPCDHARPPLCALVRDLARAAPAPAPQRETACQNNRSAAQRETACLNFGVVLKVDARAEMCASRLQTPGSARSRNFWLHGGTQSGWNGNHFVPPHGKPVWRVKPLFL
jgi:hypothetical protein